MMIHLSIAFLEVFSLLYTGGEGYAHAAYTGLQPACLLPRLKAEPGTATESVAVHPTDKPGTVLLA